MKKINETVLKETKYIAVWEILLSVLLQAVFLVIGKWNITVLFGNLLSGTAAVANFLLMGITVQNAVEQDEKDAKALMKSSSSLRLLLLAAVIAVGAAIPKAFSIWTVIIPLIFPRIAIMFRKTDGK